MLHSGSWPLLRNILSSSTEAFSCEISGITWVESDNVFLVLLRINEPRFDRRPSFWTTDTLSSSLIEYFICKRKLFYNWQSFWLFSCLIAGGDDFFVIVFDVEIKIVENIIRKIHICLKNLKEEIKTRRSLIHFWCYLQFLPLKCMSIPVFLVHWRRSIIRHLCVGP